MSGDMDVAVDAAAEALSDPTGGSPAGADGSEGAPATETPTGGHGTPVAPSADAPGATAASSTTTATTTPAPATAAPADLDIPEFANANGRVPVSRVKQILSNARTKEAARVTTELVDRYGVDPETYSKLQLGVHLQAFLKDPVQYWRDLGATLRSAGIALDPATAVGAGPPRAAAGAAPSTMPDPDMQAPDGTPAYSAARMMEVLNFRLSEFEQKFGQRVAPLESVAHTQRTAEIQREATDWAKKTLAEAKTWEGWDAIQNQVYTLMKRDSRFTIDGAYAKVFREQYLPTLKARHRQETIDELKQARPATTATPTNPASLSGPRGPLQGEAKWDAAVMHALDRVTQDA